MKRQPTWDKYEVALLIEAYINIKDRNKDKIEVLEKLSSCLRTKAINEGEEIDETFRNLNGMQWQIGYIDCAFRKTGYGNHMPSKLFQSMVEMYQDDRESFEKILYEAKLKADEAYLDVNLKNIEHEKNGIISEGKNEYLENDIMEMGGCEKNNLTTENEIKLVKLISDKFVYGFRLGSVIELMKLKKYAQENDIVISQSDEEIVSIIKKNGFVLNEKVFVINENVKNELKSLLNEKFQEGISVIYYERFMEIYREWLESNHITNESILKEFLAIVKKDLYFSKNFISIRKMTEQQAVTNEICHIWGDKVKLSIAEISEKLSYIPIEKIKYYLSLSHLFVWVSEGVYTYIKTLITTPEEENEITDFVNYECETKGYASLSKIPLGDIMEQNYELPESTILIAVYNKVLYENFYLNGKIITKEKTNIDAVALIRQFCEERDQCTLDEVIRKVKELIGIEDRRIAYTALYDVMIRVNEQRFVSDKMAHFDIDIIDDAIEPFIKEGFAAIKEVTTFAFFPICGQPWNHYLLESFCHRFSKKYRYYTNLYNGRNAGAIVERDIDWDYKELLSQAVARTNIKLEKELIGRYLFETGYMARSKFNWLDDIAKRAEQIREDNM